MNFKNYIFPFSHLEIVRVNFDRRAISEKSVEKRLNFIKSLPYEAFSREDSLFEISFLPPNEVHIWPINTIIRYTEKMEDNHDALSDFYQLSDNKHMGDFQIVRGDWGDFYNVFNFYQFPKNIYLK